MRRGGDEQGLKAHSTPVNPHPQPSVKFHICTAYVRGLSCSSCEGKLPLSLLSRYLRAQGRAGSWGNGDAPKGRQVRCARFPYTRRQTRPLSCHGLETKVPRYGGSQFRQRGEPPELRGQAAAQVIVVKVPARGAPERGHGGTATDAEGGKCDA